MGLLSAAIWLPIAVGLVLFALGRDHNASVAAPGTRTRCSQDVGLAAAATSSANDIAISE